MFLRQPRTRFSDELPSKMPYLAGNAFCEYRRFYFVFQDPHSMHLKKPTLCEQRYNTKYFTRPAWIIAGSVERRLWLKI